MPNRNCVLGPRGRPSGVRPLSRYWSFGPCPTTWTITGAKSAISTISTMTTAQAIATRSRRSRAQASCHGLRPSIASARRPADGVGRAASSSGRSTWLTVAARSGTGCRSSSPGLDREVARRQVVGGSPASRLEQRALARAALPRLRAARMEAAARRRIDRRRARRRRARSRSRRPPPSGSGTGTAESSALVYGCRGRAKSSSVARRSRRSCRGTSPRPGR